MSINFNPVLTTVAAGSFNTSSAGFIQGTALNDPAVRNALCGGVLASTETLPMWGGVGICENIPGATGAPLNNLGGVIARATKISTTSAAGALTGFSVFDQNHSAINFPQSEVPLSNNGMQVNYYRFNSGARIAVACDPALVSLDGTPVTSQVSWDFTSQLLVPFSAGYANNTITGATWAATAGGQITYTVATDLTATLAAGDDIDVSGVVSTGGTGVGYNGKFIVVSVGATTIVVTFAAPSSPGTYSSGGIVIAAGGALPVKVLDFNVGNSMTVNYAPATGFATWIRSGTAAIIQL